MAKKKFNAGDRIIGKEKKASFHGRQGTIVQYESQNQYWVMFDDGRKECRSSWWLDNTWQCR